MPEDILTTPAIEPSTQTTTSVPPKRHKVRNIILIIVVVLFALGVCLFVTPKILGLIYTDSGPIDDSDLQLTAVHIPDSENAFFFMQSAISAPNASDDLKAAAAKPYYQDPVTVDPHLFNPTTTVLPSLNGLRTVAKSVSTQAREEAVAGHTDDALTRALEISSIGNKIENSQTVLIEWLVGAAVQNIGLETLQSIATSSHASSKSLILSARSLDSLSDGNAGLIRTYKFEYLTHSKLFINQLASIKPNFYWHPNETVGYLIARARLNIKNGETICRSYDPANPGPTRYALSNPVTVYFTPNLTGRILFNVLAASFNTSKGKQCDGEMLRSATQLVLALTAYRQDHHANPATLSELVPAYLAAQPVDPYSGKSFGYSSDKGFVYSVGQHHQDSGGDLNTQWQKAENPTFSF
jgi:hypothetical protein